MALFIQKSCIVVYNSLIYIFQYPNTLSKYLQNPYFHHFWSFFRIRTNNLKSSFIRRNKNICIPISHTFNTSSSPVHSISRILTRYVLYDAYLHSILDIFAHHKDIFIWLHDSSPCKSLTQTWIISMSVLVVSLSLSYSPISCADNSL